MAGMVVQFKPCNIRVHSCSWLLPSIVARERARMYSMRWSRPSTDATIHMQAMGVSSAVMSCYYALLAQNPLSGDVAALHCYTQLLPGYTP